MISPHAIEYPSVSGEKMTVLHDSVEGLFKIREAVKDFSPEVIVEIGTMLGGMTAVFHDAAPNAMLYTFDLPEKRPSKFNRGFSKKPFGDNVKFIHEDILSQNPRVINLLKTDKRVFLYCDNSNKVKEIKNYAPYLKKGDLLGHHDFIREYSYADIESVLVDFKPHPVNRWLMEKEHSDRFWIKE